MPLHEKSRSLCTFKALLHPMDMLLQALGYVRPAPICRQHTKSRPLGGFFRLFILMNEKNRLYRLSFIAEMQQVMHYRRQVSEKLFFLKPVETDTRNYLSFIGTKSPS